MRQALLPLLLLSVTISAAQNPTPVQSSEPSTSAPTARTQFHIRYVNGSNVYIDGGRSAGLAEGTELVLKQDFTKPSNDKANIPIEPGVIAKLKVISVATTSAICEVVASSRELAAEELVSLPEHELQKLIEKDTIGNTRQYPMVVSFS